MADATPDDDDDDTFADLNDAQRRHLQEVIARVERRRAAGRADSDASDDEAQPSDAELAESAARVDALIAQIAAADERTAAAKTRFDDAGGGDPEKDLEAVAEKLKALDAKLAPAAERKPYMCFKRTTRAFRRRVLSRGRRPRTGAAVEGGSRPRRGD